MPDLDIRERARVKAEELFPERIMHFRGGAMTDLSDPWRSAFVGGAVWAVDQLPDEAELAEAIAAGYDLAYSSRLPVNEHDYRAARAVLALIGEKISGGAAHQARGGGA